MIEVSEVRRRLRQAIADGRKAAKQRHERSQSASTDYARFLAMVAVPVFRILANVLRAERYPFELSTPEGSVRLSSERSAKDFLDLVLDVSVDPPVVMGRASHNRGGRVVLIERPVLGGAKIADLTDENVIQFLMVEIVPLVER